jgi:hypothetical protein
MRRERRRSKSGRRSIAWALGELPLTIPAARWVLSFIASPPSVNARRVLLPSRVKAGLEKYLVALASRVGTPNIMT